MLRRNKAVIFNGRRSALPRFYENKVFDTEELQRERKAEKKAYCTVDETFFETMQREKNIAGRYSLKRKETNFVKDFEDFKKANVLVVDNRPNGGCWQDDS